MLVRALGDSRALLVSLGIASSLLASLWSPVVAQSLAPTCAVEGDFAQVQAWLGLRLVGDCTDVAGYDASGNTYQPTSRGILVTRADSGSTLFTDGALTWILQPDGSVVRLNPAPDAPADALPGIYGSSIDISGALTLDAQGYATLPTAIGIGVTYGFVARNASTSVTAGSVVYRVTGYNAQGNIVLSDTAILGTIPPGQRAGYSNTLTLDGYQPGGVTIAHLTTQLISAAASQDSSADSQVRGQSYQGNRASAVLVATNGGGVPYTRVSAVALGANGQVVGGGFSYTASTSGPAPISVPVTSWGAVKDVALFASGGAHGS